MSITLNDIQKAKERIAPYITETPLLRLHSLDAYLAARCTPRRNACRSPAPSSCGAP